MVQNELHSTQYVNLDVCIRTEKAGVEVKLHFVTFLVLRDIEVDFFVTWQIIKAWSSEEQKSETYTIISYAYRYRW